MIVKPLAEEINLASDTDVDGATAVRLVNTGAATLVTIKDSGTTIASLTLAAGEVLHIGKEASETLIATSSVKAVKVAYAN